MKKFILSLALTAIAAVPAAADDFFDTSDAENFIDFGARIGMNTSNRTLSNAAAPLWNQNSWGLGFNVGAVANLNFKNFISVQPGFFFETRSGAFAYKSLDIIDGEPGEPMTQLGKGTDYIFTIPVVGSLHFNILDELRWNVDFGPYLQLKLKSTFDRSFEAPMTYTHGVYYFDNVRTAKADFGFKIGTSLDIYRHYYIGVHYLAGLCHAWNPGELGGHNKEWTFTVGYNF